MAGESLVNNFEIHKKDNYVLVSVNPKLYSLEVVYSAAYSMIDRVYVILGGDPEQEILAELRPKKGKNLEEIGREFNNELINYAVYIMQSERNKKEKETLIKRALLTNVQTPEVSSENVDDIIGKPPVEDPENIAKPWKGED